MSECTHGNITAHGNPCPWCKNAELEAQLSECVSISYYETMEKTLAEEHEEELREIKAELAPLRTLAKAVADGCTGIVLIQPQSRELSAVYKAPKIMPLQEYAKSLLPEEGSDEPN